MLKLHATYRNLLSRCPSPYGDGRQRNAAYFKNRVELDLCGMLHPSTYDDAVSVNAAREINVFNYNVAIRRRARCPLLQ